MSDDKKEQCCRVLKDIPGLVDGWVCGHHGCKTYNGDQRLECKYCRHQRCDNPTEKTIPIEQDGKILIATIKIPQAEDKGKSN